MSPTQSTLNFHIVRVHPHPPSVSNASIPLIIAHKTTHNFEEDGWKSLKTCVIFGRALLILKILHFPCSPNVTFCGFSLWKWTVTFCG